MSHLEQAFATIWKLYGEKTAQGQVLFHPERDWPLDFAWIDQLLALEIQGGGFVRGAHSRPIGQRRDCEKNNAAVLLGWRILYATTDMLSEDPVGLCDQINQLLDQSPHYPQMERSAWIARVRSLTHDGDTVDHGSIAVKRIKLHRYSISTPDGLFVERAAMDVVEFLTGQSRTMPLAQGV